MRGTAYYCTVEELQKRGRDDIPEQFRSNTHLIYSSPATLAFNSPGAEGFGVKRAGLAIPDSIMLIVAPGCCGRNTSMISSMPQYEDGRDRHRNGKTFEKSTEGRAGDL